MTDESLMLLVYFGVTAFILFGVLFELLYSKLKYIKKIKKQPHKFTQLLYYYNTIQKYTKMCIDSHNILIEKTTELNNMYKALLTTNKIEDIDKVTLSKRIEIQKLVIKDNLLETLLKEQENAFEELKKELKVDNCDEKLIKRLIK